MATFFLLRKLYYHLSRRRRYQLLALLLIAIASSAAELVSLATVFPFLSLLTDPLKIWGNPFIRHIANALGLVSPAQLLVPMGLLFALVIIITAVIRLINLYLCGQVAASVGADLGREAYRRTLYQPYQVHVNTDSSSVINSIYSQVGRSVGAVNAALAAFTGILVSMSLAIGLLIINPLIAIAASLLLGSLYLALGLLIRARLYRVSMDINYYSTEAIKALQEGLGAIRDILLDSTQPVFVHSYQGADRSLRSRQALSQFLGGFPRYIIEATGMLAIILLAILLVVAGNGDNSFVPVLGTFALGAQRLIPALQQSFNGWAGVKSLSPDLEAVLTLVELSAPPAKHGVTPMPFFGEIRFNNVSFAYDSNQIPIIRDVSFAIDKSQRVAFIGSTGSGKSTLLDLLMGLLVPTDGSIEVDGHKLNSSEALLAAWRSNISHVPQSIFLADQSIAENIAFGQPSESIDFERIVAVAKQAKIHDYINSLPFGYHSSVGERGVMLSGGQRQRIGIARALYKKAQILVFDEATSALDEDTESAVMEAINNLSDNLTIIIVAHRLSTIKSCDTVIRLEAGRIVATSAPCDLA